MTTNEAKENPTPISTQLTAAELVEEAQEEWIQLQSEQHGEDYFLRQLAGNQSLSTVTHIRVVIDASSFPVNQLSSKISNLVELNLNGSRVQSIRDLGSGFSKLKVLWLSRCGLQDLEGLGSFTSLTELYASFNEVIDLQPLSMCTGLEVLDLESNCVAALESLQFLSSCLQLCNLNLTGNPLFEHPQYLETIVGSVRSLQVLNDREVQAAQQDWKSEPTVDFHSEATLVGLGIKHARVGIDSADFNSMSAAAFASQSDPSGTAPPPSAHIRPAGAATWLYALQSSSACGLQPPQQNALATVSAAGSSTQPSLPPRRVSLASGSADGSSPTKGSMEIAESSPGRPSTSRPSSARPQTASSAANRPSTASQSSSGLHWQQNRLGSSNLSSGHNSTAIANSIVDAETRDESEADPSSVLTLGMDGNFGGNFAKDLRSWKRQHAVDGADRSGATSNTRLNIPRQRVKRVGRDDLTVIDTQILLEWLKEWKLETMERVMCDEETESAENIAPWVQNEGVTSGGDVLQLSQSQSDRLLESGATSSVGEENQLRISQPFGCGDDLSRNHMSPASTAGQFNTFTDASVERDEARKASKMMSKMVLRKVIGDVGCEVFVKPSSNPLSIFPSTVLNSPEFACTLAHLDALANELSGCTNKSGVKIFSVVGEIDVGKLNPTPRPPKRPENGL